ncbi:hypothetical protein GN958_ATG08785 [Phytophthora infestans]|uniref:Uncharacterized protein n=1 Tax=Phytophthora infestans TaxID=4787 RepID=A0A8S9UMU1_PHYIN|nr:hypothetical protein GN958_ATG08785 [Phytophthora infestans]
MDEELTRALHKASIVVLPEDYSENLQRSFGKLERLEPSPWPSTVRFRLLVRMEHTQARLNGKSPMSEDALCRLYKRGLSYEWQNKYDASGQAYSTVAALVPFIERIEQGKQRLHSTGGF